MKGFIAITTLIILFSCNSTPKNQKTAGKSRGSKVASASYASKKQLVANKTADTGDIDKEIAEQTQIVYVIVADTNTNYYTLDNEMKELSQAASKPIDTMDRYYDKTKDMIQLPDTSSDELYAGDYYPRRYPTESISLEYLELYHTGSGPKTIAMVTGIYDNAKSADSALAKLKPFRQNAVVIKTSLYMGCIH